MNASQKAWRRGVRKVFGINRIRHVGEANSRALADQVMIENLLVELPMFQGCSEEFVNEVAGQCKLHRFLRVKY
jgi:hypothetical protein